MSAYDEIRALNFSSLKHLAVSPLLYQWRLTHPRPTTPALTIGSALHCAILEPGKFDSRYAVFDGTRRGKEWDKWQEDNPGVESLKPAELERITIAASAAREHRVIAKLLTGGRAEESIEWIDGPTGLRCKGRLDYIAPTRLVDIKSARDIDQWNFPKACARYGYHGQLAWYYDGAIAAGKLPADSEPPYLVALQAAEPYDCGAYQLTSFDLTAGRIMYRNLLAKFVQCTEANYWPGSVPDLTDLRLPEWVNGETLTTDEDF